MAFVKYSRCSAKLSCSGERAALKKMPPPRFLVPRTSSEHGGRRQVTWFVLGLEVPFTVRRRPPALRAVSVSQRGFSYTRFFLMQSDPMPAFAAGDGTFRSSAAACGRTLARKSR
jgi:hypothetical protein